MLIGSTKKSNPAKLQNQSAKNSFAGFLLLVWLLFSFGQVYALVGQQSLVQTKTLQNSLSQQSPTKRIAAGEQTPPSYLAEILEEEFSEEDNDTEDNDKVFLVLFYKNFLAKFIGHEQTRFTEISSAAQQIVSPPLFVLHKSFKHFLI